MRNIEAFSDEILFKLTHQGWFDNINFTTYDVFKEYVDREFDALVWTLTNHTFVFVEGKKLDLPNDYIYALDRVLNKHRGKYNCVETCWCWLFVLAYSDLEKLVYKNQSLYKLSKLTRFIFLSLFNKQHECIMSDEYRELFQSSFLQSMKQSYTKDEWEKYSACVCTECFHHDISKNFDLSVGRLLKCPRCESLFVLEIN